jgi:hypothetical protein
LRRFTLTVVALVAAALMLLPAAFASASATGHAAAYRGTGKTSQNGRVKLLLASTGRRVQITTEFRVSCDSGASFTDSETLTGPSTPGGFRGHRISRVKFDFSASDSGSINTSSGPVGANLEIEVTGNIRLDTGNAKGTIQPTLTLANGDKCTSGNTPITYSARF